MNTKHACTKHMFFSGKTTEPWDPNRYKFNSSDDEEPAQPAQPTQLLEQRAKTLSREPVPTHTLKVDKFEPRQCDKQTWHDTRGDSIGASNYSPSWSITSGMYSALDDTRLYDQRDVHGFDAERKIYKGKRVDRMTGRECHMFEDAPPPRNGDFATMGGDHSMRRLQGGHLASDARRSRREQERTATQLDDQSNAHEQRQRAQRRVMGDIRREMRQHKNGVYLDNTNALTSTPYDYQQLGRNMPFVPSTERTTTSTKTRVSNPHHTHNNRQGDYDREELSRSLSDLRECDARNQTPRGHFEGAAHRSHHAERGRVDRAALSSVAGHAAAAVSWGAVGGATQARYATVELSADNSLAHVAPHAHRPSDAPPTAAPQMSHPQKPRQILPEQTAISAPTQGSTWSLFDGEAPVSDREQRAPPCSASVTTDAADGRATPALAHPLFKEVDMCSRRALLVEEPRSHRDHATPCAPQSISLAQRETSVHPNPPQLDGRVADAKALNAAATSTAAREVVSEAAGFRQGAPAVAADGRGDAARHAPTRHATNSSRRSDASARHPLRGDDLHTPSASAPRTASHGNTRCERTMDRLQLEHPNTHPTTRSSHFTPLTSLEVETGDHLATLSADVQGGAVRADHVATRKSSFAVGACASRVTQSGSGDMERGDSARPGPSDPLRTTDSAPDIQVDGGIARRDAQLATLSQRQTPLACKAPDTAVADSERRLPTLEGSAPSDRALAPPHPVVTCDATQGGDKGERSAPTRHGPLSAPLGADVTQGVDVAISADAHRLCTDDAPGTLRETPSHAHTMSTAVSRDGAYHPARANMAPHRSQAAAPHPLGSSASVGGLFGTATVHMGALKATHDTAGSARPNEQRVGGADAVGGVGSSGDTPGRVVVDTASSTEMAADGTSVGLGVGALTNHATHRAAVGAKLANSIHGRVSAGVPISPGGAMVPELLRGQHAESMDISRLAGV